MKLYITFPKESSMYQVKMHQQPDGCMAMEMQLPDGSDVTKVLSDVTRLDYTKLIYLLKKLDGMMDDDEKTPLINKQQEWVFVMKVLAEQGIVDRIKYTEFNKLLQAANVRSHTLASVDSLSRMMKNFTASCRRFPNWNGSTFETLVYLKGLRIAQRCIDELNSL